VVLFNIRNDFGVPMKLLRLMKLCRNEACSRVRIGKYLSDILSIKNGLKQGDTLSPLLFKFALYYAIMRFQVNQDGLKFNGIDKHLVYANDINILGGCIHTIKKNREA